MRCSVVFGVTLRLLVTNISASSKRDCWRLRLKMITKEDKILIGEWCWWSVATSTVSLCWHWRQTFTPSSRPTSSSADAKRPGDASCLSVVSFVTSIVQYLERSFLLLVTSASDLSVQTIRFCYVVFDVMSSLAVIHTIRGGLWLCIVRERAWSVSRCETTVTVTGYRAWRLVVEYLHTSSIRLPPISHKLQDSGRGQPPAVLTTPGLLQR